MKQGNLTFESQIGDVYNTYKFETIDVEKWNLISKKKRFWGEENHCRRVYEKDGVYIKLWDVDYVRGSTIIDGFSSGFYDSFVIPNFMGLIVDDKMNCRGYVTKEITKRKGHYDEMLKIISQKTKETRFFTYDFCENHVYDFEGKPCLIDLEGIYRLDFYPTLESHHNNTYVGMGRFIEDVNYEKVVKETYDYVPINLDYFLNCELQQGRGGKEIVLNNYKLKTVKDVVEFWSDEDNVKEMEKNLKPENWQYWNCMWAEFRHGVGDHHKLGWENMTKEYYDGLYKMEDEDIEIFLKTNPSEFFDGFIKHSYHRAVSMIGRLINGKKYIPFYMKRSDIYTKVPHPVKNVKYLERLSHIPRDKFTIVQSGILAVMGIRQNSDLDIVVTDDCPPINIDGVEVMKDHGKFKVYGCSNDNDLVNHYSQPIGGYNFAMPRFYFSRKHKHSERDKFDWDGMKTFFGRESHLGYPFNVFTEEEWGHEFIR